MPNSPQYLFCAFLRTLALVLPAPRPTLRAGARRRLLAAADAVCALVEPWRGLACAPQGSPANHVPLLEATTGLGVVDIAHRHLCKHDVHGRAACWLKGCRRGEIKEGTTILHRKGPFRADTGLIARLRVVAPGIDTLRRGTQHEVHLGLIAEPRLFPVHADGGTANGLATRGHVRAARPRQHRQAHDDHKNPQNPTHTHLLSGVEKLGILSGGEHA